MSMAQLLATADGALKDPTIGFRALLMALANGDRDIGCEVVFKKWALVGKLNDARAPNVAMRPRQWMATSKVTDAGHRDAEALIDISYEYFGTEPDAIQENVALAATALAQNVDQWRAYSDAHAGTIIETLDPILYQFGQFAGPVSNGFLATIRLSERSTQ